MHSPNRRKALKQKRDLSYSTLMQDYNHDVLISAQETAYRIYFNLILQGKI